MRPPQIEDCESDIIKRAFMNLLAQQNADEYWNCLIGAFTTFAVNMERIATDAKTGKPVTFQETLDEFVEAVGSYKEEVVDPQLAILRGNMQ